MLVLHGWDVPIKLWSLESFMMLEMPSWIVSDWIWHAWLKRVHPMCKGEISDRDGGRAGKQLPAVPPRKVSDRRRIFRRERMHAVHVWKVPDGIGHER